MSSTSGTLHPPRRGQARPSVLGELDITSVARAAGGAAAFVGVFLMSVVLGLLLYGQAHAGRIYQGVSVAGVEVGGMTESEARSAIAKAFQTYLDQPVVLTFEGASYPLVPRESGIAIDVEATIEEAMDYGRRGSLWDRSAFWARAFLSGRDVPAMVVVDWARLDEALRTIAPSVARPPVDAYIDLNAVNGPEIVSEIPGIAFDAGSTAAAVQRHVSTRSSHPLPIIAPQIAPAIGKDHLQPRLAEVQQLVGAPLEIAGAGELWAIREGDLKQIIAVSAPGEPVRVDRAALKNLILAIARDIEHPAVDAALMVNDRGELEVVRSEASVDVNINASVDAVIAALQGGQHRAELALDREPAAISDEQAEAARQQAERLVANGVTLTWSDGSARLGRSDLIAALTVVANPGAAEPFQLGFSSEVLGVILAPVAEGIDVEPRDGRYRFVDGTVKLVEKGSSGRRLDIAASTEAITEALLQGETSVKLNVRKVEPEFTAANAGKIDLSDVLATASTYYGNSSDARRRNVERAVELESGWLVAPGDVFSYYQNIGRVDEDNGFVTGLGILADGAGGITTAPVVGGGICQVSTTIFQAAFWAGLEIVERTPHPYWLQTYGQPPSGMKGLDAMVDIVDDPNESLDLKFRNNTGNWIAVVITADGANVVAEIRGTNPGWKVEVQGGEPQISNVVEPPTETIYQDSPEFPAGEERQVETAQQGFDATIIRITRDADGNVIDEYVLSSTYVPSVNRILRGTGGS